MKASDSAKRVRDNGTGGEANQAMAISLTDNDDSSAVVLTPEWIFLQQRRSHACPASMRRTLDGHPFFERYGSTYVYNLVFIGFHLTYESLTVKASNRERGKVIPGAEADDTTIVARSE
jgi:hypothetical protein